MAGAKKQIQIFHNMKKIFLAILFAVIGFASANAQNNIEIYADDEGFNFICDFQPPFSGDYDITVNILDANKNFVSSNTQGYKDYDFHFAVTKKNVKCSGSSEVTLTIPHGILKQKLVKGRKYYATFMVRPLNQSRPLIDGTKTGTYAGFNFEPYY